MLMEVLETLLVTHALVLRFYKLFLMHGFFSLFENRQKKLEPTLAPLGRR